MTAVRSAADTSSSGGEAECSGSEWDSEPISVTGGCRKPSLDLNYMFPASRACEKGHDWKFMSVEETTEMWPIEKWGCKVCGKVVASIETRHLHSEQSIYCPLVRQWPDRNRSWRARGPASQTRPIATGITESLMMGHSARPPEKKDRGGCHVKDALGRCALRSSPGFQVELPGRIAQAVAYRKI